MKKLLTLLFILVGLTSFSQVSYDYTYIEPCSGKAKTLTVPIGAQGSNVTVDYYGHVGTFNSVDFNNGNFQTWMNTVSGSNTSQPCGEIATVLTNNINMTITQNVISTVVNVASLTSMMSDVLATTAGGGMSSNLANALDNSENVDSDSSGGSSSEDKKEEEKNNSSNSNGSSNSSNNSVDGSNSSSTNSSSTNSSSTNGGSTNSTNGGSTNSTNGGLTNSTNGGSTNSTNSTSTNSTNSSSTNSTNSSSTNSTNSSSNNGSNSTGSTTNNSVNGSLNSTGVASQGGGSGNGSTANSISNSEDSSTGSTKDDEPKNNTSTSSSSSTSTTISDAEDSTSGGSSGGGKGNKSEKKTGSMIGTGDIVVMKSAEDPTAKNQFKFTSSLTKANTDNTRVKGVLVNFTSVVNNTNATFYKAWVFKKSKLTFIAANSSMINFEKDYFNTTTTILSKRYKGNWKKLTTMAGLNYTVGNYGDAKFMNVSAIGGGFYSYNINKKVSGSVLIIGVYSPFTQFYDGRWWQSSTLIVPYSTWDYKLTKTFKFNVSFSGVYEMNKNMLNYQVLTGGKIMF